MAARCFSKVMGEVSGMKWFFVKGKEAGLQQMLVLARLRIISFDQQSGT